MLKCRDVTEMTTDYLEGDLTLPQRVGMRWHLSFCSFCRRHLKQVRATISLLRAMPPEPLAKLTEDRIVASVLHTPLPPEGRHSD